MCGYTFTVFLSAFQLFPTAPYRVLQLGGTKATAGLALGLLTYASAASALMTGVIADASGRRRTLVATSLCLAAFAAAYAAVARISGLLLLVTLHGVVWSALLAASAAYVLDVIPESRRTEGIAYWGTAATFAVAIAPSLGLWLLDWGWPWVCLSMGTLNLAMAAIAWRLPDDRQPVRSGARVPARRLGPVEWRVTLLAVTLFLYAYGYGGVTSFVALYSEASDVTPRGLWFAVFSGAVLVSRPVLGRLADRVGHVAVLLPCLALTAIAYGLLAVGGSRPLFVVSAVAFGLGAGSAYPVFAAYVMAHMDARRRGAAFGGILAALDTGIGSGSILTGWVIEHHGYRLAFGTAAGLALAAMPYFVLMRPVFLRLVARTTNDGP